MSAPVMYCNYCGKERVLPASAAASPCTCGCTTVQSWKPQAHYSISVTGPGGQQVKP